MHARNHYAYAWACKHNRRFKADLFTDALFVLRFYSLGQARGGPSSFATDAGCFKVYNYSDYRLYNYTNCEDACTSDAAWPDPRVQSVED